MPHNFDKIIEKNNIHSTFLNESGILNALQESYDLGVSDVLNWFSKMDHLNDNISYLIDEFKNQHK